MTCLTKVNQLAKTFRSDTNNNILRPVTNGFRNWCWFCKHSLKLQSFFCNCKSHKITPCAAIVSRVKAVILSIVFGVTRSAILISAVALFCRGLFSFPCFLRADEITIQCHKRLCNHPKFCSTYSMTLWYTLWYISSWNLFPVWHDHGLIYRT